MLAEWEFGTGASPWPLIKMLIGLTFVALLGPFQVFGSFPDQWVFGLVLLVVLGGALLSPAFARKRRDLCWSLSGVAGALWLLVGLMYGTVDV